MPRLSGPSKCLDRFVAALWVSCVLVLSAPVVSVAQTLELPFIQRGATWKYLDDGSDQGTAWTGVTFDDSNWRTGRAEFGYGDGDEVTWVRFGSNRSSRHVTTYFRNAFQVANAAQFRKLRLRLLRDDGAVVYLNGTELERSNMPSGPILFNTLAGPLVEAGDETRIYESLYNAQLLKTGTNVIAVELHQSTRTSPDLSFDLELIGNTGGPRLIRGPYLQSLTPNSVVVRWRTSRPTDSIVSYGTTPNNLNGRAFVPATTTEHLVSLALLSPRTRYYYSVGSTRGRLRGGDAAHSFVTFPPPGTAVQTRVWVLGDSGTADSRPASVREGYRRFSGGATPDVWLMLGDNAYYYGTDQEYQAAVFDMFPTYLRETALWSTIGNHDAWSIADYLRIFTLPTQGEAGGVPSGTEHYYSFDHGLIHFICLDSSISDRSEAGAMASWLRRDLLDRIGKATRWTICYFHHPPYTKGSHDSDNPADSGGRLQDMRKIFVPILERYGVDLVLTGHSHSYERSFLLDGHYGPSTSLKPANKLDRGDGSPRRDGSYFKPSLAPIAHRGAVYVVAGSSGKTSGGSLNHPAMVISRNQLGSMVIDAEPGKLTCRFVDPEGMVPDLFAIEKSDAPRILSRDVPGVPLKGGVQTLRVDAGPRAAGKSYLIAGSFGTRPGFMVSQHRIPLNRDALFLASLLLANSRVYAHTQGKLDPTGRTIATVRVPPSYDQRRIGLRLFHACALYDGTGLIAVSNSVSLEIGR